MYCVKHTIDRNKPEFTNKSRNMTTHMALVTLPILIIVTDITWPILNFILLEK